MLRTVKHPHLRPHLTAFKITTVGPGSSSVDIGTSEASAVSYLGAGDTGLTLTARRIRSSVAVLGAGGDVTAGGYVQQTVAPTASSLETSILSDAGGAIHGTCHGLLLGHDSELTDTISPLQPVHCSGVAPRIMGFKISSNAISIGSNHASLSVASSVYALTLRNAFGRNCVGIASPISTSQKATRISPIGAGSLSVSTYDASGAAEDNAFYLILLGWDSKDDNASEYRVLRAPQLKPRMLSFRITNTAGTPSITKGVGDATVTDNGTGDYSLTWTTPFAREPIVIVSAKSERAQLREAATTTGARVLHFTFAGVASDGDVDILVLGDDSATEV